MPEYERAVVFRLGRLTDRDAKGPGIIVYFYIIVNFCIMCLHPGPRHNYIYAVSFFSPGTLFILPCIDKYTTVDLRTKSFDVPPQNVSNMATKKQEHLLFK